EKRVTFDLANRFASEVRSTVTFAFNSDRLDANAQAILRQQAGWIRQFPEMRFRVYGHTDLVGSQTYNRALGLRRAQA
ncbi:OmpA family protein, partial [Sulfitobacter sp. HI0076]